MHRLCTIVAGLILCALALGSLPASAATPVVLELFTSQGCSSCPPAEKALGELARRPNVIALAYHVDYWDGAQWRDPFSLPQATQRQRGYAQRLSRPGVFTPQVIVSGDTSLVGSDRRAIENAIAEPRDSLDIRLTVSGNVLSIELLEPWREALDLHLVTYLDQATTTVGGGENAHRTIRQFNIVRSFQSLDRWNGQRQQRKVPLSSLPNDATAVVVLLQRPRHGAVAGAASMRLPK